MCGNPILCLKQRSVWGVDKTSASFHPPNRKAACLRTHISRWSYQLNQLPGRVVKTECPSWNYCNYNPIRVCWKKENVGYWVQVNVTSNDFSHTAPLWGLISDVSLSGDNGWIVHGFARRSDGGFLATFPRHDIEKRPHSSNHCLLHLWDIVNMLGWLWNLEAVFCATYMRSRCRVTRNNKAASMSRRWYNWFRSVLCVSDSGSCFHCLSAFLFVWNKTEGLSLFQPPDGSSISSSSSYSVSVCLI